MTARFTVTVWPAAWLWQARESNEVNHKNQNIDFDRLTERRPSKKGASNGAMTASFPQFRQNSQTISASKPDLGKLAMCLIWGSAKHWPEVRLLGVAATSRALICGTAILPYSQQLVRWMMNDGDECEWSC